MVQTESWYQTYGTQYFAVYQVYGAIYAINKNGEWELTKDKATIDPNTHHILMSATPLAGSEINKQELSIDITPEGKMGQHLPIAESTRTPGLQGQSLKDSETLAI